MKKGRGCDSNICDAANWLTREVDPLGNYRQHEYDAHDNVIATGAYDDQDNPLSIRRMGFDDLGRLLWSNINSGTTDYAYNDMGWLTHVALPDPDDAMIVGSAYSDTSNSLPRPERSYTHDDNGNVLTETNEIGEITSFAWDNLNRLTSRTDPEIAAGVPVTSFTYDALSNLKTLTDPVGNTTTWTHDTWGRVLTETNALSKVRTFSYDILGNLTKRVDRLGREIRYSYDRLEGNLASKTRISNGDKEEYEWDYRNRLSKVTFKNSGGTILKTVAYRYDHNDVLLRRIETPYSGGSLEGQHHLNAVVN